MAVMGNRARGNPASETILLSSHSNSQAGTLLKERPADFLNKGTDLCRRRACPSKILQIASTTLILAIFVLSIIPVSYAISIDDIAPRYDTHYGEKIVVKGSDVVAGVGVYLYWDAVSNIDLLNTTDAKADGTFEFWFYVPKAVYGVHYLWVKDTNTGDISGPYYFEVHAKISLSPSSGLKGETITITGHGFDASARGKILFGGVDLMISVSTDSLGSFVTQFSVPDKSPGEYFVEAFDENVSDTERFNIVSFPTTITGIVTDVKTGDPIGGATVKVDGEQATTDSGGSFSLSVDAGSYTVTVSKQGYQNGTSYATVGPGETQNVLVTLSEAPTTITGIITDVKTGEPIMGATVTADGRKTYTDSDGSFALSVDEGNYTVTVSINGDKIGTYEVTVDKEARASATITGIVTDVKTRKPIGGATVTADGRKTYTDSDGSFSLSVDEGSHTVTVSKQGYQKGTYEMTGRKGVIVIQNITIVIIVTLWELIAIIIGGIAIAVVVLRARGKPSF